MSTRNLQYISERLQQDNINVLRVDCDKEKQLCHDFNSDQHTHNHMKLVLYKNFVPIEVPDNLGYESFIEFVKHAIL
ncbi:hypothetical protein CYY_004583 [Polysphondylium violaceum]|uniref:Uncharacterized protein n=1 Tax=Polysphondylium violaceum TaxID=133409 RepID=A0A8J4V093_9MYCE|nr:hypothetical protein CYY_004583 [Polysphondylium violaceum]